MTDHAVDAPAPEPCDILIIGGGPAGATAGALLAERGRDVVVLEKNAHPRFHIGESLLPRNLEVIDRLGLRAEVARMGVLKPGAEFVSDEHGSAVGFDFATGIDRRYTYSFQVPRAEFDEMLFRHAGARGARTFENTRVTDVTLAEGGRPAQVTAQTTDGAVRRFAPRYILDASGRDTFLGGKLQTKRANKLNTTAAVFGHFRNAECRTGDRLGYITVHLVENGWFWMIPLPDDVMSVGFVGTQAAFKERTGSMEAFFLDRIRRSPSVNQRMECAELISAVTATGNYSYRCGSPVGDGYMMIGDAFGFLDPIFSSGVLLAMNSGELAADVAHLWLDDPAAGMRAAHQAQRAVNTAMDTLSWLIHRINTPVMRDMFMSPQNRLRMRDGLVSLLAGNLGGTRFSLPVLAFKGAFVALSLLHRAGYRLHDAGFVRARQVARAA